MALADCAEVMRSTDVNDRRGGVLCGLAVSAAVALFGATAFATPHAAESVSASERREDAKLMDYLQRAWHEELVRDPTLQTRLGLDGGEDRWTPTTDEREMEDEARARRALVKLHHLVDLKKLSTERQLDEQVYEEILRMRIRQVEYHRHTYFFTRKPFDPYLEFPQLLISAHPIRSARDARGYLSQMRGLELVLNEAVAGTLERSRRGIVLPAFNFPDIAANSRAFATGRPCDAGPAEQSLWRNFQAKVNEATLEPQEREQLLAQAESVVRDVVCPAYQHFAARFADMGRGVTRNDGLWSLPGGEGLYRDAIALHTSMEVDPSELHQTGLKEVERIEKEIREVMERAAFHGSIREFFESMAKDPRYLLPQTDAGRSTYLAAVQNVIDNVQQRLPDLFLPASIPQAALVVRAVEPAREASLGTQVFYDPPHGETGPGVFYVGLADMAQRPLWEIEPLTYHEALPGHHLQITLANSIAGISEFRRHYTNSAYQEGWGLYAEGLGKELGGYTDEYSRAARYRLELLRAVRIVVETGFHHEHWNWDQCAAYLSQHQGVPLDQARKDVTRYMVWPGQGVSYKLGELEINRLRATAEAALGASFDVRAFHAMILNDGVLPSALLQRRVSAWIGTHKTPCAGTCDESALPEKGAHGP
jgi:uncharacterized protein (DUF885 family)